MNNKLTTSIIKTLCYAQIFSYPLTVSELWKYLIFENTGKMKSGALMLDKKISREDFIKALSQNTKIYQQIRQYVVFSGDDKLIAERAIRAQESRRKLAKALWISQILSFIPGVKLIAISGSLAMYNTKPADDIDLFFITGRNCLWTTRFLVNITLLVLGEKRKRSEKYAMDKICPNMFIAEDALEIKTHNLYLAHEIAQIKVLISRENMHYKFLEGNRWVLKYLPHAFSNQGATYHHGKKQAFFPLLIILEYTLFKVQYFYMKKKITNEKIKRNSAFFHPRRQGDIIMTLYNLRLKAYHSVLKITPKVKDSVSIHVVN